MKPKLQKGDVLLVVDVQYDFLPNGSLAVPDGDKIIPIVNNWIEAAQKAGIPIIFSRDWHPSHHISFKERGGPWPVHCVQNTKGAKFHADLKIPQGAIIVNKATDADKDAYSAFEGYTDDEGIPLPEKLKQLKAKRIWIAGLAFDYCVHYSTLDARKLGFAANVILPACRSIAEETEQKSFKEMAEAGVTLELDSEPYIK
jgi:nicotinamidase/pyrazinamidase